MAYFSSVTSYHEQYGFDDSLSNISELGNYAIAYAMYQRGDMDLSTYNIYKNNLLSFLFGTAVDPFASFAPSTASFVDDGWTENDDVGFWVSPNVSDPDGHWTGSIITNAGSDAVQSNAWWEDCELVTCHYNQYGKSYLENFNLNHEANSFKNTIYIGNAGQYAPLTGLATPGYHLSPLILYATTERTMSGTSLVAQDLNTNSASNFGFGFILSLAHFGLHDRPDRVAYYLNVGPFDDSTSSDYQSHSVVPSNNSHQFRLSNSRWEIEKRNGKIVLLHYYKCSSVIPTSPTTINNLSTYKGDYIEMPRKSQCSLATQNDQYMKDNWGLAETNRWYLDPAERVTIGNPGRSVGNVWWLANVVVLDGNSLEFPLLGTTLLRSMGNELNVSNKAISSLTIDSFDVINVMANQSVPLFTKAPGNPYPPPGLSHLGNRSLYIKSIGEQTSNIPLMIKVREPSNNNVPLYMYGTTLPGEVWAGVSPLYMRGQDTLNGWAPLYIDGIPVPVNDNMSTFVHDSTNLQNLTTFTADDGAGQYTNKYSYSKIRATVNNNSSSRLYKDMATDYFNISFETRFQLYVEDTPTTMSLHPVAFTNSISASSTWASTEDALVVECYNNGGLQLRLKEYNNVEVSSDLAIEEQRQYYIKVERLSNKITLSVYTDSAFSALVGSVSLYMTSTALYRYVIVGDTLDIGGGDSMQYNMDNLRYQYMFFEDNMPLFTKGIGQHTDFARLYIEGFGDSDNSFIPLQVYGSGGGLPGSFWYEGAIPLFLKDTQQSDPSQGGKFLYLRNTQSSIPFIPSPTLGLKLYIGGGGTLFNPTPDSGLGSIPLFLFNEQIAEVMSLYMEGPPKLLPIGDGTEGTLPIYLFRPNEVATVPLVMYNNTPTDNTFTTLYINGILGRSNNNVNLVIPNAVVDMNTFISLYIQGAVPVTGNIPLVMPNTLAIPTGSIPLMIQHGGGLLNSFVPLYIFGANIQTGNIPLVMPEVIEIPNDTINLYTQGY